MARNRKRIARGLAAGVAGGLVASWVMNQFQTLWSKASEKFSEGANGQEQPTKQPQNDDEDASMKVADKISRNLLGRGLNRQEKEKSGPIVHYAFGSAMGFRQSYSPM